ncbi:hypothetical protein OROGR_031549 [Orobanche gracilis]
MIPTLPPPSNCLSASAFLVEPKSSFALRSASSVSIVRCSDSRKYAHIPKLEPFNRNKIDRALKDPPLIQKSQDQIADYCLTLEGDDCYSCWKAYFELEDLEKEVPKEEVERLIIQAGEVESLISFVHGVATIYKAKKERSDSLKGAKHVKVEPTHCPIPDGLPKTAEEMEEDENATMPYSPYTRLLRARGRHTAWYTPFSDHETD